VSEISPENLCVGPIFPDAMVSISFKLKDMFLDPLPLPIDNWQNRAKLDIAICSPELVSVSISLHQESSTKIEMTDK
jgi:hypothetical protein